MVTLSNNNQARPRDSSDSEDDEMGDLAVSYTQFVSARYILTTAASDVGLSISGTDDFLETQPKGGEVRLKWGNGRLFWNDHARRQRLVLPSVGKWSETDIEAPHIKIPHYCAWVRDLPQTITQVISVARCVRLPNLDWSKELNLDASIQTNAIGQRIVHTFQSADDLNYLVRALRLKEKHRQTTFVPLQLFIDKANVTRLNKRSMYPVVLYLLCFSRRVRRILAVNVAFIPVISALAKDGSAMSAELTKLARASAIQQTLKVLLIPLIEDLQLQREFTDGIQRVFTPLLFSIIADLPEVAVLLCMNYGLKTHFPVVCLRPRGPEIYPNGSGSRQPNGGRRHTRTSERVSR